MSREIRTERNSITHEETQVLYDNGQRVGEVRENTGMFSSGSSVYDSNGSKVAEIGQDGGVCGLFRGTEIRDTSGHPTGSVERATGVRGDNLSATIRERNENNTSRGSGSSSGSSGGYSSSGGGSAAASGGGIIGLSLLIGIGMTAITMLKADPPKNWVSRWEKETIEYLQQGNLEEAIKRLDKIAIWGQDSPVLKIGALQLEKKADQERHQTDYVDAKEYYEQSLKYNDKSPSAWNGLGITNEQLGSTNEAVRNYDSAIALDEQYNAPHHNKGLLYLKQNKPEEALSSLDRTLELAPLDQDTWRAQIIAYDQLHMYEAVLYAYKELERLQPTNMHYRTNRQALETKLGR